MTNTKGYTRAQPKLTIVSPKKLELLKTKHTVNLIPEYYPYYTTTQRIPIKAGMPYLSSMKFTGVKKVGYKVVEFVYGTNPEFTTDMIMLGEYEVSRNIYP